MVVVGVWSYSTVAAYNDENLQLQEMTCMYYENTCAPYNSLQCQCC